MKRIIFAFLAISLVSVAFGGRSYAALIDFPVTHEEKASNLETAKIYLNSEIDFVSSDLTKLKFLIDFSFQDTQQIKELFGLGQTILVKLKNHYTVISNLSKAKYILPHRYDLAMDRFYRILEEAQVFDKNATALISGRR